MIKQTLMFTTPVSVTDKQYGDIINFWGKEKNANRTIAIGVFLVNLPQKSIISATS